MTLCWLTALVTATASPLWDDISREDAELVWRQMGNERMRYVVDMNHIAVKIGPERQLFLDNYLVGEATNITREVHHPVRSEHNPMLDDQIIWWLQHVMMFDESPRFRMWYNPGLNFHKWNKDDETDRIRFVTAYAVSEDGVNWKRPDLGIYQTPKYPYGNITLQYGMMHGLFYEPWEEDPEKRFKAVVCVEGRRFEGKKVLPEFTVDEGYYLHWSPDGIHWKGDLDHMVIPSQTRSVLFPIPGMGDTSRFWWDPVREKYMVDAKTTLYNPTKRSRSLMESDDLVHWSRGRPILFTTAENIQVYGHAVTFYQGMYIGFRWHSYTDYFWQEVHSVDIGLDCSRDAVTWTRVGGDQLFMERKDTDRENFNDPHAWDADQMAVRNALVVDDEIWIYYNGAGSVGLAKLRLDGYVSLNGGEETGTVVTRPLTFKGKKLRINAEVAKGGEIRVAFRTRDGEPVEGFTIKECKPLTGDSINMQVEWEAGRDISALSESFLRIEFQLRNAKIYAFWFEPC